MSSNSKKSRIKNLESCLNEAKKIHDQILKYGVESGANRKELQDSISQQVSIIRLLQSEARLSNTLLCAVTAFAGSIAGVLLMTLAKF
jgi:Mg2+ and Co2+ transporter CorA